MSRYRKRIDNLERKREQKLKVPVVIAVMSAIGVYIYNGNMYNEEQFRTFVEKVKPDTIILDNTKLNGEGRL